MQLEADPRDTIDGESQVSDAGSNVVRTRAIALSLLGAAPIALFVQWSDIVVGGTMAAGPFPPLAAALLWSLLLAAVYLSGRGGRKPLLRSGELLVVLAAWVVENLVVGRGLLHPLLATLAGPVYYARSGAVYRAVSAFLPSWLVVQNPSAARGFFEGHVAPPPMAAWMRPLETWALFFVPFLIANICLGALFERVWVRQERLAYPLVALPLEVTSTVSPASAHGAAHRSRFLAIGLSVPLLLHGFGVAHAYLPDIPCIPFFNDLSGLFHDPPWSALNPLYLNIYPLLIGLSFLAPADISLSVWFFLLLAKIEMVVTASTGWNDGSSGGGSAPSPPFLEEQSAGAYLTLAALLIWNARLHLAEIRRSMRPKKRRVANRVGLPVVEGRRHSTDNVRNEELLDAASGIGSGEGRANAALGWGFVFGVAGILIWCVRTGLPLWFALGFFGFYFAVALVLSRLMAEGGVAWILAPILPDKLILSLAGTASVSPLVLTRITLHMQHLRDTRQMLAPTVGQTGKLRDTVGMPSLHFYCLLAAGAVLALVIGAAAALPTFYTHGALPMAVNSDGLQMSARVIPLSALNLATDRLTHPTHASSASLPGLIVGAIVTVALSALRTRCLWWPLHPLGYALTGTLQQGYANKMLFSIFVGWALKALTLRFGGVRGFRSLRNIALGLILGDILMGGILKLLDAILGPSGYAIF